MGSDLESCGRARLISTPHFPGFLEMPTEVFRSTRPVLLRRRVLAIQVPLLASERTAQSRSKRRKYLQADLADFANLLSEIANRAREATLAAVTAARQLNLKICWQAHQIENTAQKSTRLRTETATAA